MIVYLSMVRLGFYSKSSRAKVYLDLWILMPKKKMLQLAEKSIIVVLLMTCFIFREEKKKKKNRDGVRSGIKKETYWRRGQGRKKEK